MMRKINDLNLITAIDHCCKLKGHRVGIFVPNIKDSAKILEIIKDIFEDLPEFQPYLQRINTAQCDSYIEFKNGSYIDFVSTSGYIRGLAFYEILYDERITDKATQEAILSTMRLRRE